VLSACFAEEADETFRSRLSLGFCDALSLAKTHLLGGDTSSGRDTILTSTGVGLCSPHPITRIGAKPGDLLVLSGKSGIGAVMAYRLLLSIDEDAEALEQRHRPAISHEASQQLAKNAHAMIDTSDGILAAVTTICALNKVGVRLCWNANVLDEDVIAFCSRHRLPLWALWVAEHGDYQLLGVVAREQLLRVQSYDCQVIGEVTDAGIFELEFGQQKRAIDPSWGQLVAATHRHDFAGRCRTLLNEFRELDFP
jgi:thiamine monophosphate kinase